MGNHQSIWIRLFSWNGKVDRGFYAIAGLVFFIVKWNIDRLLGGHFLWTESGNSGLAISLVRSFISLISGLPNHRH